MMIGIYTHPDCLEHDTGPGHPENTGRLQAVLKALKAGDYAKKLAFIDAPYGTEECIRRAHSRVYIHDVKKTIPESGYSYMDADTVISPGSWDAALRAVGAACRAVDDVMSGQYAAAFCAVRPPGHHAEKDRAMGFCLFNNIAVAALHALEKLAIEKVAIVDFDVHHGNGTQDIFETERRVLYASTHQVPLFPGTGLQSETGQGNIVNIPLRPGTNSQEYRTVFTEKILPALKGFGPDILLVSAGFDAHEKDPLANLKLNDTDFEWIGAQLHRFAQENCQGRTVSFLEGGYDHQALAQGVCAYLRPFLP